MFASLRDLKRVAGHSDVEGMGLFPGEEESAVAGATAGSGSGRILILDDDPAAVRILRRVLEADGHRVAAIPAALEDDALEARIAHLDPEVLLLDPGTAGDRGLERTDSLKALRPWIEIIVLASDASVESAVLYMRRGVADYLAKTFDDCRRLRFAVRRACATARASGSPGPGRAASPDPSRFPRAIPLSLEAYERHALERALRESGGDAARAARNLGIGRSTLYRKLARHGLRARSGDASPSPGVGGRDAIG